MRICVLPPNQHHRPSGSFFVFLFLSCKGSALLQFPSILIDFPLNIACHSIGVVGANGSEECSPEGGEFDPLLASNSLLVDQPFLSEFPYESRVFDVWLP